MIINDKKKKNITHVKKLKIIIPTKLPNYF